MRFQRKSWPDRFWEKVEKGSGCWPWKGAVNKAGYGVVQTGTNQEPHTELAHRVAWSLEYGPIPAGVKILHRCDNPPCVRYTHLFDGSQSDNMKDCAQKGRHPRNKSGYLPKGEHHHLYRHGMKITREIAAQIRTCVGPQKDVARRFGVSASLVSRIKSNLIWK